MRKRLRGFFHLALVWTVVCLLSLDTASACRLLGGRHRCCCPCPPSPCGCAMEWGMSCEMQAPPGSIGGEGGVLPSPSDVLPGSPSPPPAALQAQESPAPAEPAPLKPQQAAPAAPAEPAPTRPTQPAPAKPPEPAPPTPATPKPPAPTHDDPFAPIKPTTPAPTAPAPAPARPPAAAPKQATPDEDDPFAPVKPAPPAATKAAKRVAAPLPNSADSPADPLRAGTDGRLPLRQWADDSGQFQVTARLILILDGKVRLLKETGRTTTVPLDRLSNQDREYVAEIIARYGNDLTKLEQLAAR